MNNFIEFLYSRFLLSDGVSIDTRTIEPDNLFFGLRGPNFNGSQYAAKALESGASYAVVDDPEFAGDSRTIMVDNSLKALQDLAVFHRSRYKRVVLGLTGSNGKTTTKELLTRVLSKNFIVHSTSGNYNNHIGVPLTILDIYPQVEIAIIEMGANHVGEIKDLCDIANPTHGLITNIGKAHTEGFGGIDGVLRGKSELFDHLRKNHGQVFINSMDMRLSNMSKRFDSPVIYPNEDVRFLSADPFIQYEMNGSVYKTNLIGQYNFENIASAISMARYFNVPDDTVNQAIASYEPDNLRAQIINKNGVRIVLDAYNANPDSMAKSLESFKQLKGEKIAVLGVMNEIENPEKEHEAIGKLLDQHKIRSLLLGGYMKYAANKSADAIWFETREELETYLQQRDFKNMNVLLKASRSVKLESLVDVITK